MTTSSLEKILSDQESILYFAINFVVPKESLVEALSAKDRPYEDITLEAARVDRADVATKVLEQMEALGYPKESDGVYLMDKDGRCRVDTDDLAVSLMNTAIKGCLLEIGGVNMAQNIDHFRKLQGPGDVIVPVWERHEGKVDIPGKAGTLDIIVSDDRQQIVAKLSSDYPRTFDADKEVAKLEEELCLVAGHIRSLEARLKPIQEYGPREASLAL